MKYLKILTLSVLGALGVIDGSAAEPLRCTGVLGNSGEQGASLVRFGTKPASGLGVIHDNQGSLWDRGGEGVLNRYAIDGRLLATYRIAPVSARTDRDKIVALGDTVLLKLGRKLYTLPMNAPSGATPTLLPVEAMRVSFNTREGWAAAALDKTVFLVNAAGEKRDVAVLETAVEEIDIGPEGGVYVQSAGKMVRVDTAAPPDQKGPWPAPGERPQWLDGHWYGNAWHGTIRRFAPDFTTDPGVVLGGASGSFIGYVEGNTDIENAAGLTRVGGDLFAVSGIKGCLHLLSWSEEDKRFSIVRRIGAVPAVGALAIDGKGRVWYDGGVWNETAGPDTPRRDCVPAPDDGAAFGASMLANDVLVAPAFRWGKACVYYGPLDAPSRLSDGVDDLTKALVASAVVTVDKRTVLVVVDAAGRGKSFYVGADGRPSGPAGEVVLQATVPLKALTSLTSFEANSLVAAADGQVIEFTREQAGWRETRRWNQWGEGATERFGARIFVTASERRLWVADTGRHRVLGFDSATRRPLGSFGQTDAAGDTLDALSSPTVLAANGHHLAIYDAGNQRILRLERAAD